MPAKSPFRERQPGWLTLCTGGMGHGSGQYIRAFHDADGRPFPMLLVQIDTDPTTSSVFDRSIQIGLTAAKVEALVSNPTLFGPTAQKIVERYPHLLNPEDVENGSRTIRLLTQLAFIYHEDEILRGLRRSLLDLCHQGEVDTIVPVFMGSSGGGSGSALQVLLAQALTNPRFRARLMEGLPPGLLQTPIAFVVEPFAFAMRNQDSQANMILANALAYRMETAQLENQDALKYVFHLGLASRSGVVLDSPTEIAKVLGTTVYQFQRNWLPIKALLVNNVDTNRMIRHYGGMDLWEIVSQGIPPDQLHGRAQGRAQPGGNGHARPVGSVHGTAQNRPPRSDTEKGGSQ